jgi:hypothetical protein
MASSGRYAESHRVECRPQLAAPVPDPFLEATLPVVGVLAVASHSGLIQRDFENAWLASDLEAGPLDDLIGHSITCRIAVGPRAGQMLFTLQTAPPRLKRPELDPNGAASAGGLSPHAGVDIAASERETLERVCRYVSRPPVATARVAALAPPPRKYLTRYHGVFGIEIDPCQRCAGRARESRMLRTIARHPDVGCAPQSCA